MAIKNTTRSLLTALSIPLVMAQDQSSDEFDLSILWGTGLATSISVGIFLCVYCVMCKGSSNSTRSDIENQVYEPIDSPTVSDHEEASDSETDEIGASSLDERDDESSSEDENENGAESENESERSTSSSTVTSSKDSDAKDNNFEITFADRLKLINVKAADHLVFKRFLCPITLEVPTDIVWSSQDDHYYDRRSLEKWLETHSTSPCIPSMKLNSDLIFPVNQIKQLLEDVIVQEEKKFKSINQEKISADADRPLLRRSLGW